MGKFLRYKADKHLNLISGTGLLIVTENRPILSCLFFDWGAVQVFVS